MGYPVTKLNSCQFQYAGKTYALALILDEEEGNIVDVFMKLDDGTWNATPPWMMVGVTNEQIMAHGSVANYLASLFPLAEQNLKDLAAAHKPDPENKFACSAFDAGLDIIFNETTERFEFNKAIPLSHAR